MPDIKKFTGYLSSDGKTHNSQKAAVTHEQELKTKKALEDGFGDRVVFDNGPNAPEFDDQTSISLATFLYDNREAVLAALNQEVLLRKKRTPKVKTTAANDAVTDKADE